MLAYKDGRRVRLMSRNAVDHTARFREVAAAIARLRAEVLVLDGEVAVFDKELVSASTSSGIPLPASCTRRRTCPEKLDRFEVEDFASRGLG